jgi:hypothetical protein
LTDTYANSRQISSGAIDSYFNANPQFALIGGDHRLADIQVREPFVDRTIERSAKTGSARANILDGLAS